MAAAAPCRGMIGRMVQLRPFQASAVAEIRGAYMAGHRRVLFVLPTGGGKTYTFVHIA